MTTCLRKDPFAEDVQEIVVKAHLDMGDSPQEIRDMYKECPSMTPEVVGRALQKFATANAETPASQR